jgi:hypothetical protein
MLLYLEMMPCLHNYVTVDPQAFLAEPKYCEIIFNMCKQVSVINPLRTL